MTFDQLNIINPILKAIAQEGYTEPSPIQEQAIPVLLQKHDMLASAQTGTGKTAAFAIPIIQGLYQLELEIQGKKRIQALILAPTRELAEQIKDSFRNYSRDLGIITEVVYGGVSQKNQEIALKRGVDVLIATPGRLLDLMAQRLISLKYIKYFVLDEADRMLDMGFIHDVKKIASSIPKERQTMLFSATLPKEIINLAKDLLKDPVRIEVTPPEAMVDKISQKLFHVTKKDKSNLLIDLLVNPKLESVLIFTRTKQGANKLVKELLSYGVKADAIHGNKSQSNRQKALEAFKAKNLRVLVATDIAARGIDIDELSHVINYDLPETPETYVHRMGRTGRAGLSGEAYTFCSTDEDHLLKSIEKHIDMKIPVVEDHLYHVKIRIVPMAIDIPMKNPSRSRLKNKTKDASKPVKNNFKEKKSYHDLLEEQETGKKGFKRSELPRKKAALLVEKDDQASYQKKSFNSPKKPYQPKDYDLEDRQIDRKASSFKKPYTPRESSNYTGEKKTYTPRENTSYTGEKKAYTPRPNKDFGDQKRSYPPKKQNDFNSHSKKPH